MRRRPGNRKAAPKQRARRVHCQINRLGHQGDGVADLDGRSVYVPLTLAAEQVEVDVVGDRGQLVSVTSPSADRVEPLCPHFGVCGGCSLQHFAEDAYRDWKRKIVEGALRHRDIECSVDPLVDAHGDGRRRVTVHTVHTATGVIAGFNRHRDRRIVDINACPVLDPGLRDIFDLARRLADVLTPVRGSLHVRALVCDNGVDVDIGGVDATDLVSHEALANLAARYDLARLTIAGEQLVERRSPTIRTGPADLVPSPTAFMQATNAGETTLADLVLANVPHDAVVADLFCGAGPFALRLAGGHPVLAVDIDEAAIQALDRAVRHTPGLKPVSIVRRDLFEDPLSCDELVGRDVVVFDPPRAGAEAQARKLAVSDVKTIIGVSCNPVTFARDAALLTEGGYQLTRVTPVDQFRHTSHVELVGVFQRSY